MKKEHDDQAMPKATATIGFAGHRQIATEDLASVEGRLERCKNVLFKKLGEVLEDGAPPKLLCGYAPGADRTMVTLWQEAGGTVHLLFPYLDPATPQHLEYSDPELDLLPIYTDHPKTAAPEETIAYGEAKAIGLVTVLDGAAGEVLTPARSAHLEQSRWLVRFADLLVVVWNGKLSNGPGGTADTVLSALARGITILWIMPAESDTLRIIDPAAFPQDAGSAEIVQAIKTDPEALAPPLSDDVLGRKLREVLLPPWQNGTVESADEREAERSAFAAYRKATRALPKKEPGRTRWWRGEKIYDWFCAVLAKKPDGIPQAKVVRTSPTMEAAQTVADAVANRISARHRSQQVVLLLLATIAVFIGVLPAAKDIPPLSDIKHLKLFCVAAEVVILSLIIFVWWRAQKLKQHRLWSDARRLGERLRIALAIWPLGIGVSDVRARPARLWSEWVAQSTRRAVGPPEGILHAVARANAVDAGRAVLLDSQSDYHKGNATRMTAIHHRLERLEMWNFWVLFVPLLLFLVYLSVAAVGWVPKANKGVEGFFLILSAFLPAIGAMIIALEAQFDFGGAARRSARLHPHFEQLKHDIADQANNSAFTAQILREAAALSLHDVNSWRDDLERRRLIRGG